MGDVVVCGFEGLGGVFVGDMLGVVDVGGVVKVVVV